MQSGEHFERFAIEGCLGQRFNQTLNHSRISGRVDDPKAFRFAGRIAAEALSDSAEPR